MKHVREDCCYEEMSRKPGGQSMPQEYHDESSQNEYEMKRKSFYGPNGFDWSEMRRES